MGGWLGRTRAECTRAGIESRDRVAFDGVALHGLGTHILVEDLCHVGLLGLLNCRVILASSCVGDAPERVVRQNLLYERIEYCDIRNLVCHLASCGL
ncbi:MAG: hypothetical protein WCF90_01300 [Methanomicrobiales archaeon]